MSSDLLKFLDFLRPLFILQVDIIDNAISRFNRESTISCQETVELQYFHMSIEECKSYFIISAAGKLNMSARTSLMKLFKILSIKNQANENRVLLLDIITILSIITQGPLEKRMKYLFECYNISKSGLMNEIEHSAMIIRLGSCLRRMNIIDSNDLTNDDAANIAFKARSYIENDLIRFLPGLKLNDFINWIQHSPECSIYSKFIHILNKLIQTMTTLEMRTSQLYDFIVDKYNSSIRVYPPVLDMELLSQRIKYDHSRLPVLVYRSRSELSLIIELNEMNIREVFIKVEKMEKFVPLLPRESRQRLLTGADISQLKLDQEKSDTHHHQYYIIKSYRRQIIKSDITTLTNTYRIDIDELLPDSRYQLTIFTFNVKYKPIIASTVPKPFKPYAMNNVRH